MSRVPVNVSELLTPMNDRLWHFDTPPKKIYVAASLANKEKALFVALSLVDAGFTVTSRWLRTDFSSAPLKDSWKARAQFDEVWGQIDIADLEEADTLVLLTDKASSTGGGFT